MLPSCIMSWRCLQFTDLLALCGDASDNVPGVRGIGPKTAAPLLVEHGNLEGVLAAAPEVGSGQPGVRNRSLSKSLPSNSAHAAGPAVSYNSWLRKAAGL